MKKIKELLLQYKEIIMYLIVGVITTVFNWVVYAVFVKLLEACLTSLCSSVVIVGTANILSWFVTVLFAYITNKIFVFESRSWKREVVVKESLSFFGARAATGVFEIIAQPAFFACGLNQKLFGVEGLPAKVLVSAIVMVLNYVCSKLFVFKKEEA